MVACWASPIAFQPLSLWSLGSSYLIQLPFLTPSLWLGWCQAAAPREPMVQEAQSLCVAGGAPTYGHVRNLVGRSAAGTSVWLGGHMFGAGM